MRVRCAAPDGAQTEGCGTTTDPRTGFPVRLPLPAALRAWRNLQPVPRTVPAPQPKGHRVPGSGRKKGTPNRVSVEAKLLCEQLVNDPHYQWRLREDFRLRRVHPTIEAMVWAYFRGKPLQPVAVSGQVGVAHRFEREREQLAGLGLSQLEALEAQSRALLDAAFADVQARQFPQAAPPDVVVEALRDEVGAETLGKQGGSDKGEYVALSPSSDSNSATPSPSAPYHTHDACDDESNEST